MLQGYVIGASTRLQGCLKDTLRIPMNDSFKLPVLYMESLLSGNEIYFTDSLRINKGVLTSVLQRSAQGWRPILNSGEKLCILCVDCVIIL